MKMRAKQTGNGRCLLYRGSIHIGHAIRVPRNAQAWTLHFLDGDVFDSNEQDLAAAILRFEETYQ